MDVPIAQFLNSFSQRPEFGRMQTHESYEGTMQKNLEDRADRIEIAERFGVMITADHKVLNEDQVE